MIQRREFMRALAAGAGAAAWAGCKGAEYDGADAAASGPGSAEAGEGQQGSAQGSNSPDAGPDPSPYASGDQYDYGGAADGGSAAADCSPTTRDVQGPFFEAGAPARTRLAAADEPGERLRIEGRVEDDACAPIAGALLDVWQADMTGTYHAAGTEYRLRGQVLTDAEGRYAFETIRPGNYLIAAGSWRPAHIHFTVSKPGHRPLTTQLYFEGDPYLPPNDGCGGCGSNDPARIIPLFGDAQSGWSGGFHIVLARG